MKLWILVKLWIIMKWISLCCLTFFALKSTWSYIKRSTLAVFWLVLTWHIFFHALSLYILYFHFKSAFLQTTLLVLFKIQSDNSAFKLCVHHLNLMWFLYIIRPNLLLHYFFLILSHLLFYYSLFSCLLWINTFFIILLYLLCCFFK